MRVARALLYHLVRPRSAEMWLRDVFALYILVQLFSLASAVEAGDPFRLPPPEALDGPAPVVEGAGPYGVDTPDDQDPGARGPDSDTDRSVAPRAERVMATIPLHHADAAEVAEALSEQGAGMLSSRGQWSVDTRTNTLILHDTPGRIRAARALAEELDNPVQQVVIEARIVLTSGDYASHLGKRLGVSADRGSGSVGRNAAPAPGEDGEVGFMVDLGLDGEPPGQIGVSIGQVGRTLLQMELSAMEAEGRGQVVSAPRILTAARQEATIQQGVQIPYQEVAESGATAVAFQDAALSLTATPSVSDDGRIELSLEVTKDAVGQIFEGVPSIDTQVLSTHLHLEDGETAVLGGVQEQESQSESRRVPWFADIPGIGWLFRSEQERERHSELLVFVTPRVWD